MKKYVAAVILGFISILYTLISGIISVILFDSNIIIGLIGFIHGMALRVFVPRAFKKMTK